MTPIDTALAISGDSADSTVGILGYDPTKRRFVIRQAPFSIRPDDVLVQRAFVRMMILDNLFESFFAHWEIVQDPREIPVSIEPYNCTFKLRGKTPCISST